MKTKERISFEKNIADFAKKTIGKRLERLVFFLDTQPTFDLNRIPFTFKYALSVTIEIERTSFHLHTAQSSTSLDTLWIQTNSETHLGNPDLEIEINEIVRDIKTEKGIDDFIYKLTLLTDNHKWTFIAADFYDNYGDSIDYKINDEMIIAFDNYNDLKEFEKRITAHNKK